MSTGPNTTVAYRPCTALTHHILWLSSALSAKYAVLIHYATVVLIHCGPACRSLVLVRLGLTQSARVSVRSGSGWQPGSGRGSRSLPGIDQGNAAVGKITISRRDSGAMHMRDGGDHAVNRVQALPGPLPLADECGIGWRGGSIKAENASGKILGEHGTGLLAQALAGLALGQQVNPQKDFGIR